MKKLIPALLAFILLCSACKTPTPAEQTTTAPSETTAPAPVLPSQPTSGLFGIPFVPPKSGGFNPITNQSALNAGFIPLVYESLFKRDEQFRPVALLCQSYEFSGHILNISLKEGVLFHDDTELTAADVVYSLQLAKNQSSFYASRLSLFSDFRATDRYSLSMYVAEKNARVLALLEVPIIKANTGNSSDAVGSGRYRLQTSDELRFLTPFSDWHSTDGEEPAVPHLLLVEVPDMDALIYNLAAGNLDGFLADPLNSQGIAFPTDADRYTVETSSLFYLAYNTARSPFHQTDVRVGLGRLIDRQELSKSCFSGFLSAGVGLFPQSAAFADEALLEEMAGYNVSAGLALLDQAGYRPDGNGVLRNSYGQLLTVSILVNADNSHKTAAAQAIAEMLTSAGVTASVSALSFDAYKQAAENGDFDVMLAETTLSPHFDYAMLLSENGALNFGKYASASVSNFISDFARTLFTDAEYPGAALAAHVAENAPILPLGYKKMVFLVRKSNELVGIKPTVSDPFDNILNWSHR